MVNNLNNNNANRRRRRDAQNNDGQPPAQRRIVTRSMARAQREMNSRADVADQMLLCRSEHLQNFRQELRRLRGLEMYQYPDVKEVLSQAEDKLFSQPQHDDTRNALMEARDRVYEQYPEVLDMFSQRMNQLSEQYPQVMTNLFQERDQVYEQYPQVLEDFQQAILQRPEQNVELIYQYVLNQPEHHAARVALMQLTNKVRAQAPEFAADFWQAEIEVFDQSPQYVTDMCQAEMQVLDQQQHHATRKALVQGEREILNRPENAQAKQAVRQASADFVKNHPQGQEAFELVKTSEIARIFENNPHIFNLKDKVFRENWRRIFNSNH